jgi:hypothetical protein
MSHCSGACQECRFQEKFEFILFYEFGFLCNLGMWIWIDLNWNIASLYILSIYYDYHWSNLTITGRSNSVSLSVYYWKTDDGISSIIGILICNWPPIGNCVTQNFFRFNLFLWPSFCKLADYDWLRIHVLRRNLDERGHSYCVISTSTCLFKSDLGLCHLVQSINKSNILHWN